MLQLHGVAPLISMGRFDRQCHLPNSAARDKNDVAVQPCQAVMGGRGVKFSPLFLAPSSRPCERTPKRRFLGNGCIFESCTIVTNLHKSNNKIVRHHNHMKECTMYERPALPCYIYFFSENGHLMFTTCTIG